MTQSVTADAVSTPLNTPNKVEDHTLLFLYHSIMKIFAKRKRTVVDPETAEKLRKEQEAQKKVEADKAVQELLKLDPSKLNAKQRRLVKRYKERHGDEMQSPSSEKTKQEKTKNSEDLAPEPKSADAQAQEESSSDSSDSDNSSRDDESVVEAIDDKNEMAEEKSQTKTKERPNTQPTPANDGGKNNDLNEGKVKKLLEKLNSKQRRKLMRLLEREGNSILEEVHAEAITLLKASDAEKATSTNDTPETKKDPNTATKQVSGKKRKKDWSDLPPEERLRREEQRRMQQEAAARRAKEGPSATKRHPLNSERRRANRRKPKWESKRQPVENEHDTSGYHMRKLKKAGQI